MLITDNTTKLILFINKWKVNAAINVVFNKDTLVLKGHGLGETK
jgi:hypothetical protein